MAAGTLLLANFWPAIGRILLAALGGIIVDIMRDPMPLENLTEGVFHAACYLVIGYSLAFARMLTRDG
jgi:ABC-2 type transport system permease protein